jgi:hypothetical protein
MDLIPYWNEGIGVIDDVMVLRVCAQLSQDYERGGLSTAAEASLDRMANQSEKITAFLGGPIYDKLKAYCAKLGDLKVRGATPTELAPILEETHKIIVYQEQVMKIANALTNYSMAEADDLHKTINKKITEIMAAHRERFHKGAVENGVPPDKAASIFDLMEKFGGYGFNKSHSAAYALIAYQTAYLKAHFGGICALATSEMGSIDPSSVCGRVPQPRIPCCRTSASFKGSRWRERIASAWWRLRRGRSHRCDPGPAEAAPSI